MRRWRILLGCALVALGAFASSAAAETPLWNPLGQQDILVIPIQHTPTKDMKASDCQAAPVRKKGESDADFKARQDNYVNVTLPTWTEYLTKDMVGVRKTASQWGDFMNTRISGFYNTATYGQTRFRFRMLSAATANGWWPAPHSLASYCSLWKANKNNFSEPNLPIRDAIEGILATALAKDPAAAAALLGYHRVLVLQNLHRHGGVSRRPPGVSYTLDTGSASYTRNFTVSYINEEADDHAAAYTHAHELGHQLGLPDFYYWKGTCAEAYTSTMTPDCGGQWDLMAVNALTQFNAHARILMGWLPGARGGSAVYGKIFDTPYIYTDPNHWSQTYGLYPIEGDNSGVFNVPRALRIPFQPWTPGHFSGYLVECRRKLGGDEIPAEGVVVRAVSEGQPTLPQQGYTLRVVDPNNPNVPMSIPGQGFTINLSSAGAPRYLSVRFSGFSGPGCAVTVTKQAAPPVPVLAINKGVEVISVPSIKIPGLRSPDVWVDSPKNGYGKYDPEQQIHVDHGVNVPARGGDVPWPGHRNRIYFRVRNVGAAPARRVRVTVRVRPALTDPECVPARQGGLSTTLKAIARRSAAIASVPWTPSGGGPAQIRIDVAKAKGEPITPGALKQRGLTTLAQHTAVITTRIEESVPAGGKTAALLKVTVAGGCGETRIVPVVLSAPPNWQVRVSPPSSPAVPRQRFNVLVRAAQNAPTGTSARITVGFQAEQLDDRAGPGHAGIVVSAFDSHTDLELIAGVELTARVTAIQNAFGQPMHEKIRLIVDSPSDEEFSWRFADVLGRLQDCHPSWVECWRFRSLPATH